METFQQFNFSLGRFFLLSQLREFLVDSPQKKALDEEGDDVPGGDDNGGHNVGDEVHHLADGDRSDDVRCQIDGATCRVHPFEERGIKSSTSLNV